MLPGLLETLERLDPAQPWRMTLARTTTGGRVWRLFLDAEASPRLVLREP